MSELLPPQLLAPELLAKLAGVRSVGAITGAGISVGSGLPTYRGTGGVYDDPEEGDRTMEDLGVETMHSDPGRTWRRLAALARNSHSARPNAAHEALARIERAVEHFVLLTQNVDRLHQAAGSVNIIDIHGDLGTTLCTGCGKQGSMAPVAHLDQPPACADCGASLRADVVLFGEMLATDKLRRLRHHFHLNSPDLVLVVGTTALFPYIVEPVLLARQRGRLTVEINPEPTVLSPHVDYSLRGGAVAFLPALAGAIEEACR